jgi:hypothetical protein
MADAKASFARNSDVEDRNHIENIADEAILENDRMKTKKK